MLGIAVRVAQAMSLHLPNPPFEVPPFEHEMGKRVWYTIGALDTLLSLDHMSEPIIRPKALLSHPPSNINDSDISFDMEGPVRELSGFTDVTYPLIVLNCICALRALNFTDFSQPAIKTMNMRQQAAMDFQQTVSRLLEGCQEDTNPFHWFVKKTAECMVATVQLVTLRPMQKCSGFVPPRVHGGGILKLSMNTLQSLHELHSDPRGVLWRMSDGSFAIWHAFVVAVSELRACGDPSLIEQYWPFIENVYEEFSSLPESHRGAIWDAVEKFMAKGRAHKDMLASRNPAPPANVAPTQAHAFSMANIPSSVDFSPVPMAGPQSMVPEAPTIASSHMVGPWPNVFDAVEYGTLGMDNVHDSSWLNYEGFIDDLFGSQRPG